MPESNVRKPTVKWPYVLSLFAAFLLGLIPMWSSAHNRGNERDAALRQLELCRLTDSISAAAMFGKRGEYEHARQRASSFFTRLSSEVSSGTALSDQQRSNLRPLLDHRDGIITLLARSDPAGVDRLFDLENRLRQQLPQ